MGKGRDDCDCKGSREGDSRGDGIILPLDIELYICIAQLSNYWF